MPTDDSLQAILKDLNILIEELENNPQISSWTVRLVLKAIKDKAQKGVSRIPTKLYR